MAQAFNTKGLKGYHHKQLIMLIIKACKKLKIPFDKMNVIWKICHKNTICDEPITNG